MRILVDTSVWIDFFNGSDSGQVSLLEAAMQEEDAVLKCGLVLMEILQGIRSETELKKTKDCLDELPCLSMERATFEEAARMYRTLRKTGVTIRKPMDCLIAAVAMQNGLPLLHNDRDFLPLIECFGLRTCESEGASSR